MKIILRLLYVLFYFKIPNWLLIKILKSNRIELLKIISLKGHYTNRLLISEKLNIIDIEPQIVVTEIVINDNIPLISQNGIQLAISNDMPDALQKKALAKKKYWTQKEAESAKKKARMKALLKNSANHKRKFSDGETYQQAKNMLKKPMNTGRWM